MRGKKRLGQSVLFVLLLAALLGVMLCAVRYWENHLMARPDLPERSDSAAATERLSDSQTVSILLVTRMEAESLDAVVLCHFDSDAKTVSTVSFHKHVLVSIPGYSEDSLESSYKWGEMDLLARTLEENFGVSGEITLEIDADDLSALMKQLDGAGIQEMLAALDAFLEKSESNLTDKELLNRLMEWYPMLKECTVEKLIIPAEGTYTLETDGEKQLLNPDKEANRKLLADFFESGK